MEPGRETETFAELALELDSARRAGTHFLLRAGKALSRRRKMAIVRFPAHGDRANELRIGVDGPHDVSLRGTGGAPIPGAVTLSTTPSGTELPAYGHVLPDLLSGGSELSIAGEEGVPLSRLCRSRPRTTCPAAVGTLHRTRHRAAKAGDRGCPVAVDEEWLTSDTDRARHEADERLQMAPGYATD